MIDNIKRFLSALQSRGLEPALLEVYGWLLLRFKLRLSRLNRLTSFGAELRSFYLSELLEKRFQGTVQYGPFKGLQLAGSLKWNPQSKASMLLGLYEKEICDLLLKESCLGKKILVDLGAADGFYAVGSLRARLFEYAFCFESSEKGRSALQRNALINGVEKRMKVFGEASVDWHLNLPKDQLKDMVIIFDIEGAEFELLTPSVLATLKESTLIVELHHEFVDRGGAKLAKLIEDAKEFFVPTFIRTTSRDLSQITEIESFSDIDRWLLCSEGRPRDAIWVLLKSRIVSRE